MSLQHGSEMLEIQKTEVQSFHLNTQEETPPLPWRQLAEKDGNCGREVKIPNKNPKTEKSGATSKIFQ